MQQPSESPLVQAEHAVARATHALVHTLEGVLRLPGPPASRWHRAGVSARGERLFNAASGALLLLFVAGWSWSIAEAHTARDRDGVAPPNVTRRIAAALSDGDAPSAAFVTDAALALFTPLRGASGKLRAHVRAPGAPLVGDPLPAGARVAFSASAGEVAETTAALAPRRSGVWRLAVRVGSALKPVAGLNVITLTPFSEKRRGRIGLYYIGSWPGEKARRVRPGYETPNGFIEVTRENQDTPLSDHFRLRDFLTHDQQSVWPKYLVVDTRLVDKLELVLGDLEARGHDVSGVRVMSGFRTPQYNAGGGDPSGRAGLSRHMYGDAADIYIDSDADGSMDDLNGDGRVSMRDAEVVRAAVDRVERAHPALVGGCGAYPGTSAHGPFVHVDTRGYRARWVGSGDG